MINVYDFCNACAEATTVKLSFFDTDDGNFITTVILPDAKLGCKTLTAICGYACVEYFYISDDLICAKVLVHSCDM